METDIQREDIMILRFCHFELKRLIDIEYNRIVYIA